MKNTTIHITADSLITILEAGEFSFDFCDQYFPLRIIIKSAGMIQQDSDMRRARLRKRIVIVTTFKD